MKLCVVGGGKMAEALVGGLITTGWASALEIGIIEISATRREELTKKFRYIQLASSVGEARKDTRFTLSNVLLAVKPQHVLEVADELHGGGVKRVLSIAAGVRIDALRARLGEEVRVVRAMPNTPALVGVGAAAVSAAANATAGDAEWAHSILAAVGSVCEVAEADLDAVTAVSGSGPAYVFLLAEAMTAAGVENGLSHDKADQLTRQTILGAATLLCKSGDDPAVLRANVTSPNGTTAAAIKTMKEHGLEQIVGKAIRAAAERSRELGGK